MSLLMETERGAKGSVPVGILLCPVPELSGRSTHYRQSSLPRLRWEVAACVYRDWTLASVLGDLCNVASHPNKIALYNLDPF